jgi:ActR/RegA family two-component response regulator
MMKPMVLLVDDETPFVETMTKRLSKRDLKIIAAFSGEEALEILNKNRIQMWSSLTSKCRE